MSINEDNGNMGLTDIFKRTYCPQSNGVLEATIKGTTSSFMRLPKLQSSIQSIILREYPES